MKSCKQLTQEQGYQISALLGMEHNQTTIANIISVHKSTINRELRRNRGKRGYRLKQAHRFGLRRLNESKKRIEPETWNLIEQMIRKDWSPEQISGWLKSRTERKINHEWIYQYILTDKQKGSHFYKHLRYQKKRRKRHGSYDRRGKLTNRVSTDQRPAEVQTRQRLGDWEVDTNIGRRHKQAIVILIDRKSRLVLLRKVEKRTAGAV